MEQSSALLAVWMQGASIANLSFLTEQAPDRIENHLRSELHKIRAEVALPAPIPVTEIAPPAPKVRKAGQGMRAVMARECAAKPPKPAISKTAPQTLVKRAVAEGRPEFREYPPFMRRKDQTTARQVYEQLKRGPRKLDELAEQLGVSYDTVWLACKNMLKAGLVQRTDEQPYRWTLVERAPDQAAGD